MTLATFTRRAIGDYIKDAARKHGASPRAESLAAPRVDDGAVLTQLVDVLDRLAKADIGREVLGRTLDAVEDDYALAALIQADVARQLIKDARRSAGLSLDQ